MPKIADHFNLIIPRLWDAMVSAPPPFQMGDQIFEDFIYRWSISGSLKKGGLRLLRGDQDTFYLKTSKLKVDPPGNEKRK